VNAIDLLASLVVEDGRRWGEAAAPFQWEDARAVLDPVSATPYHFLTRARGGSKTSDLGAMAIAAMLAQLPARSRLYGIAADQDQGRLLVDSVSGFAARSPQLRGALKLDAYRVTATRSGSTLDVLAADAASSWGLRPDFLVLDELAQWGTTGTPRRIFEAVTTAVAKMPGARLAILTTAGDPAHWSRKILDHALSDPLWRVAEVPGPPPWIDRARLAEQRRRLTESSYRRLFLNQWVAAEDRLVSDEDLRRCVVLDGPLPPLLGRRYWIGLDLGVKRDRTVAAVCHGESLLRQPDAAVGVRVVLDRMEVWTPKRLRPVQLEEVERWLTEASRAYNSARLIFDPWQAVGMVQRLRSRGVLSEEFTFSSSSVGRLASTLHLLLRNQALALPDNPELLDELAALRLVEPSPGVLRVAHDPDRHDDRAIALGLAAQKIVGDPLRVAGAGRAAAGLPLELPLAAQVLGSAGVNVHSGIGSVAYGDRL
jgi:hypothetical protein